MMEMNMSFISVTEPSRHRNTLCSCREAGVRRNTRRAMFSPLHPAAYDNSGFELQPHDIYSLSTITGGKILQMDRYPVGV